MKGIFEKFPNSIFTYLDYRNFLRDIYTWGKRHKRFFNYQYFADLADFKSVGYLKMVMDGHRNISPKSVAKIAKALELGKKETVYFETLVLFNQAENENEKGIYRERLVGMWPRSKPTDLSGDHLEFFTKPHHVAIREMIALPAFQEDPEWIAARLRFPLKPKDIEESLRLLTALGLIQRNADGKLEQRQVALSSPPETPEFLGEVYTYHQSMLSMASTALIDIDHDKRDISAITVPLPVSELNKIKEMVLEFREKVLNFVNHLPPTYDSVYQMNIQLFPLTNPIDTIKDREQRA